MKAKNTYQLPKFDNFRATVDAALTQPAFPDGLYNFHTEAFDAIRAIFSNSPAKIPDERMPLNGNIGSELGAVRKELILSHMLLGTPERPYYELVEILRDALRQNPLIPNISTDDERWIKAIHIAQTYLERNEMPKGSKSVGINAAEITFAQAINFFSTKGVKIRLIGDDIMIESKRDWDAIAAVVSAPMKPLGDTRVMQCLDIWLSAKFEPTIQRVHLHPTPDLMARKLDRTLPYGHLYRLAIKMLGCNRSISQNAGNQQSIGEAAKHFAALYEVEPFSTYESTFPPYHGRIIEVLRRVVQFDELFNIPQCDPSSMELLLRDLFEDVSGSGNIGDSGWSLNNAIALWQLLLSLVPCTATSTFIPQERFRQLLTQRVGTAACRALLNSFVLANPNRHYSTPADAARSDTRECVIAIASADRYWIAPRPFIGPAFFARLVTWYAKADKRVSQKIGDAFEARMLQRLKNLGISVRSVEVVSTKGAKAGDIDLLIETDKIIGLFELKKKGLTRKTNAGDDLKMLADLARGVVHGINQLSKHELTLRQDGQLKFSDGTFLTLGQRDIFKGVITLADYGGLHDGAILRNALTAFSRVTFNSHQTLTTEQQLDLDEIERELVALKQRVVEFSKLVPQDTEGPHRTLFDNLVFHNVFFIEHLLLSQKTAEDFLTQLRMLSRIVTGSRDSIFDIERFTLKR